MKRIAPLIVCHAHALSLDHLFQVAKRRIRDAADEVRAGVSRDHPRLVADTRWNETLTTRLRLSQLILKFRLEVQCSE